MKQPDKKIKKTIKGIKLVGTCAMLAFVVHMSNGDLNNNAYAADTAEEIRDEAKEDIKKLKEQMKDIEAFQASIAENMESAAEEMESLMVTQKELNDAISLKQGEIEKASEELLEALTRESEAYEAMKLRMQYMYENNTYYDMGNILLDSENVAEVLSQVEYVKSICDADRKLKEEYKKAVADVEEKQEALAKEMDELLVLQDEYELRQANLEVYMAGLGEDADTYSAQIADAKEQVKKYEAIVKEQDRIIAEKKAAEEAARLKAEREKAEKEAAEKAEAEANKNKPQLGNSGYLTDSSYNPGFTSNVTGDELVKYALQFVGNPYKWGGNSLTKGCDCSGFVKLIYAHFGFDTPRYSQSFKTYGKPVSFENMQAGDIVVYPGHVAIYIGNGYIVEAQNYQKGITCNRLVTSGKITAIRRVL